MDENGIIKIHTAARRYCMDWYTYWTKEYQKLMDAGKAHSNGYHYTDKALGTFPRYHVLKAILWEIEMFSPQDFSGFKEAKELLKASAEGAHTLFTKPPCEKIAESVMNEERDRFCHYIDNLTMDGLNTVESLFFRKSLTDLEGNSIWQQAQKHWDIPEGYWLPLAGETRDDVLVFQEKPFLEELGATTLIEILKNHGVKTVYAFSELGRNCEYDIDIFDPYYGINGEGFWFSRTCDWILYSSHESSMAIGGSWLLSEIKKVWPNWKNRIWDHPYY